MCLPSLFHSFENFDKHTSLKEHPYIGMYVIVYIYHYISNHICVYSYVDVWPLKNKPGDNGMPSYVAYIYTIVWKLFDRTVSLIIKFKVKYFCGYMTSSKYFIYCQR